MTGDDFDVKVFKSVNSTIWLDNPRYSTAANWPIMKDSKYEEIQLGLGEFFDKIAADPKAVGYYYLSGNISDLESAALDADVFPSAFFSPSKPLVRTFYVF